jgi:hypothetical protein
MQRISFFNECLRYDNGGGVEGVVRADLGKQVDSHMGNVSGSKNVELDMLEAWREESNKKKIEEVNRHLLSLIRETKEPTQEEVDASMRLAMQRDIDRERRIAKAQFNVVEIFKKFYNLEPSIKGAVLATLSTTISPLLGVKKLVATELDSARAELLVGVWKERRSALIKKITSIKEEALDARYHVGSINKA